jgi:hypothetical protein
MGARSFLLLEGPECSHHHQTSDRPKTDNRKPINLSHFGKHFGNVTVESPCNPRCSSSTIFPSKLARRSLSARQLLLFLNLNLEFGPRGALHSRFELKDTENAENAPVTPLFCYHGF